MRKRLTPGLINRLFGAVLAIFLAIAGVLYWQGYIKEIGLILVGIVALLAGICFIFGIRATQRDGFLDGYSRAKDEFDKNKGN